MAYIKYSNGLILYDNKTLEEFRNKINPDKLFVANNTLDTVKLKKIKDKVISQDISTIKNEIDFNSKYNLVFISRLLETKMPGSFVDIMVKLLIDYKLDVTGHIIGDGPEIGKVRSKIKQKELEENVILYGARFDDEWLGKILIASNIVVIPGALGLSINHAFCFDKPVATFGRNINKPIHGPEYSYLSDGETALIAPYPDTDLLAKKIYSYLTSLETQERMTRKVVEYTKTYLSSEKMIDGFTEAISSTLKISKS
jgi:glycosyltransferase involved in cell wall biosynthesis